jgi:hypothetical protein
MENAYKAKLQIAYAWIIAQDKCPECYSDLSIGETIVGNVHRVYAECCNCGKMWENFGIEVAWEELHQWRIDTKKRLGLFQNQGKEANI